MSLIEHMIKAGWTNADAQPERMSVNLRVEKLSKHQSDFSDLDTEPKRKTGGWIKFSDADGDYYCCSECGLELPRMIIRTPSWEEPFPQKISIDKTKFCPYCGSLNK